MGVEQKDFQKHNNFDIDANDENAEDSVKNQLVQIVQNGLKKYHDCDFSLVQDLYAKLTKIDDNNALLSALTGDSSLASLASIITDDQINDKLLGPLKSKYHTQSNSNEQSIVLSADSNQPAVQAQGKAIVFNNKNIYYQFQKTKNAASDKIKIDFKAISIKAAANNITDADIDQVLAAAMNLGWNDLKLEGGTEKLRKAILQRIIAKASPDKPGPNITVDKQTTEEAALFDQLNKKLHPKAPIAEAASEKQNKPLEQPEGKNDLLEYFRKINIEDTTAVKNFLEYFTKWANDLPGVKGTGTTLGADECFPVIIKELSSADINKDDLHKAKALTDKINSGANSGYLATTFFAALQYILEEKTFSNTYSASLGKDRIAKLNELNNNSEKYKDILITEDYKQLENILRDYRSIRQDLVSEHPVNLAAKRIDDLKAQLELFLQTFDKKFSIRHEITTDDKELKNTKNYTAEQLRNVNWIANDNRFVKILSDTDANNESKSGALYLESKPAELLMDFTRSRSVGVRASNTDDIYLYNKETSEWKDKEVTPENVNKYFAKILNIEYKEAQEIQKRHNQGLFGIIILHVIKNTLQPKHVDSLSCHYFPLLNPIDSDGNILHGFYYKVKNDIYLDTESKFNIGNDLKIPPSPVGSVKVTWKLIPNQGFQLQKLAFSNSIVRDLCLYGADRPLYPLSTERLALAAHEENLLNQLEKLDAEKYFLKCKAQYLLTFITNLAATDKFLSNSGLQQTFAENIQQLSDIISSSKIADKNKLDSINQIIMQLKNFKENAKDIKTIDSLFYGRFFPAGDGKRKNAIAKQQSIQKNEAAIEMQEVKPDLS